MLFKIKRNSTLWVTAVTAFHNDINASIDKGMKDSN